MLEISAAKDDDRRGTQLLVTGHVRNVDAAIAVRFCRLWVVAMAARGQSEIVGTGTVRQACVGAVFGLLPLYLGQAPTACVSSAGSGAAGCWYGGSG
jgi:hypothetical protein